MSYLAYLSGCAVKQSIPETDKYENIDMDLLLEAAKKHKLEAAAGMALEKAGVKNEKFRQAVALAQRKNALLDADMAKVLSAMEEAGIWHMPLKGAILKAYYPRYGMRQMTDYDILFDAEKAEEVREIMQKLGFECVKYGKRHCDNYEKEPVSRFEMHRKLFDSYRLDKFNEYFANIKERLIKDDGNGYGFHFTDEDFYLYIIAHEYKHFSAGGTGLRSLLDIYVYLKKKEQELNWDYISRECRKLDILEFEKNNRNLALHLFDQTPLSETEDEMLKYVFSSGAYGTIANEAGNQIRDKGRLGYFLSRLTLPKAIMYHDYPILKKAPFLYPFIWIWRLIYKFFTANRKFTGEIKAVFGTTKKRQKGRIR